VIVVVAGSRGVEIWDTYAALAYCTLPVDEVVCGMADGADMHGWLWAKENNKPVRERPANWKKNGKAAGPIRNGQMAQEGDGAIVVWDGVSRGALNMAYQMQGLGKPCELYGPRPSEIDVERDI